MANPEIINLTANEWEKVATNVTTGNIKRLSNLPNKYLETYRLTGQPKPTQAAEGAELFTPENPGDISATAAIDVYVMAVGNDGKVRADV